MNDPRAQPADAATTDAPAIVWFRRDLRVHDHPALVAAATGHARVVPLFVFDPRLLTGRYASAERTWFMSESVRALGRRLASLGTTLVIRVGDPRTEVSAVALACGARDVYVSRDHAPYGRTRDAAVAAALAAIGVGWHARRGVLVQEPEDVLTLDGRPFSVYGPFRRAWEGRGRRAVVGPPTRLGGHEIPSAPFPTLADLGFGGGLTADVASLPEPGEDAARTRLDRWLATGIETYAATRDRTDLLDGTSRLSADLRFGLISPLEVVERAAGPGDGRRVFTAELIWREFYAHLLFHRPGVRTTSFAPAFDAIPWSDDQAAFDAWCSGRTGYPYVDAAMRRLTATGWMHNRARMVVASFLTKDLLIDWRRGEAHFMRHLVDGDVASNNGGWQWSASTGADPQPYFRIFNPVTQGQRYDPDGDEVRRWVPELRDVPTLRIHAPWQLTAEESAAAGCRIGIDYPAPIVDHARARIRALAVYEAARRTS